MLKIFKYLLPKEWLIALISVGVITMQVWVELSIIGYMSDVAKLTQSPTGQIADILRVGSIMLGLTLVSLLLIVVVNYFTAVVGSNFSKRLREIQFTKVNAFSMEEISKFSVDSLITRSTNDITQVQMLITMGFMLIVRAPITAIWAVIKMQAGAPEWVMATAGAVAVLLVMITFIIFKVMPKFQKMQSLVDNINRVTREGLTGLRVARAYNAEDYQETKFEKANDELTGTQLYTSRAMAIMMPTMMLIMSGISLAIYFIGAGLIDSAPVMERVPIFANMVVFSSYAVQIIMAFVMLMMIFIMMPRASVSAKRVLEVLESEPSIVDGSKKSGNVKKGELEFKNVSFKYPGASENILNNISFTANPGETVAFIGSTGSGKSTIINLIPRLYDVTSGEILVDGVNVKDYVQEDLFDKLGYVSQKAILFRGTVSSNVIYGSEDKKKITEESIKQALDIAQGTEFVEKMEKGYNSEIAQAGTNVSGGQKQRLSIARAIYKNPEIFIFDDSFSALDYKTDRVLRATLERELKDSTKIIVAQRIGTIMEADKIIVVDNGEIVGMGKHRELLNNCEVYLQIARSQLSEEELA